MKKILFSVYTFTLLLALNFNAQNTQFGSYGEINFQQHINDTLENKGTLNINRLFLTIKSQLNNNLKFSGALELNDNKNFSVEHAYLDYEVNEKLVWRNGLIFVPMGKLNAEHISTEYNGSLRTLNDTYIVPTTWTAYGTGITGDLKEASLKYQAYIFNGLNDVGLNGENGFRAGIRGGSNAEFSTPNFSAKIDYYGFENLNIGVAAYTGNTNNNLNSVMDSSLVSDLSIGMLGIDAQYQENNLFLNGQFLFTQFEGTDAYNEIAGFNSLSTNFEGLGSKMLGYYLSVGYNYQLSNGEFLVPFVTFERAETHNKVGDFGSVNDAFNRNLTTVGVSYKPSNNVVYKLDYQMYRNDAQFEEINLLNAAVHYSF